MVLGDIVWESDGWAACWENGKHGTSAVVQRGCDVDSGAWIGAVDHKQTGQASDGGCGVIRTNRTNITNVERGGFMNWHPSILKTCVTTLLITLLSAAPIGNAIAQQKNT